MICLLLTFRWPRVYKNTFRLWHVTFHQKIRQIPEWEVRGLQGNSHGLLQSQERVSSDRISENEYISDNIDTGRMGVRSGPWVETSYLKLCQSSRTRWMRCSSLTAQQQWVNDMDSFEDCDDNNSISRILTTGSSTPASCSCSEIWSDCLRATMMASSIFWRSILRWERNRQGTL